MERIILHIDFDSFFASVEQQDNPLYRNRPLGVTATNGRTCIIAASREAKKCGVGSPSRTHDARKLCPGIIFVPAHFVRYWEVSKQFIKICDAFSPTVEVFSLDEVFIDVTLTAKLFGGVDQLIKQFKERLRTEVGEYITASVGISHNKLLAKMASSLKKPNGVMTITPESLVSVYQTAKLTDVCGIGYGLQKRLHQLGITSLLQLREVPLSVLVAEFGNVRGHTLHDIAYGRDERPLIHYRDIDEVKSVGRQYCLPANEYDKRKVFQNIYELSEEVALKLRRLDKKARSAGLYLSGSKTISGNHTLPRYFNTGKDIFEICRLIIDQQLEGYVRQIGVWASHLRDVTQIPLPLLPYDQKKAQLTTIIDKINNRFGDHTIRNAYLLYADKLTTVPNGYGTDRYDRLQLSRSKFFDE